MLSRAQRRMDMIFLSHFENRIDRKGRVSVPAPFRAVLDANKEPAGGDALSHRHLP